MSQTAMAAALVAAGVVPVPQAARKNGDDNTQRRPRSSARSLNAMHWENKEIGSLVIQATNFNIGSVTDQWPFSYAPIVTGTKKPDVLEISFQSNLESGVFVYTRHNTAPAGQQPVRLHEEGAIPSFGVSVVWDVINGQRLAYTRKTDMDNIDIFFVLQDGTFVNLQVAVLYRNGVFYLSVHEVGAYQVVRIPLDLKHDKKTLQAKGGLYALATLQEEQVFPGADFLKTMGKMGEELIPLIVRDCVDDQGASFISQVTTITFPQWNPPETPSVTPVERRDGWMGGVVKFCNPIISLAAIICGDTMERLGNLSLILDDDGEPLMEKGKFPVLLPREPVLVKLGTAQVRGKTTMVITAVKRIKD